MAKLGEICTFQSGGTPSKSNSEYFNGSIPWITTVALTGDYIDKNDAVDWITDKAIQESAAKIVPENSILVGTRVGIGKVAINTVPMSTSQDIVSLINVDDTEWDKRFLCKVISARNPYLLSQARGATIKGIKIDTLAKLEIPEFPVDAQRRIAAVLDKVSDLIAKRRAQLDKLDLLVKARFVEMFGKTQYPHTALIKLIVEGAGLSYGVIVPGDNVEDGIPMIRPSDFKNDNLYLDEVYRVAPEIEAKYARTRLIGDEILVQVIGQPGQVMLADSRCKGMNVTRNLAVVRPNCNRINRIYLKTYMQTQEAQAFMLGETKQSTLKQLPLSKLKELEILVPPMALQEQFATFVEQINKSKLSVRKSLEKLKILKKALMQQYFG